MTALPVQNGQQRQCEPAAARKAGQSQADRALSVVRFDLPAVTPQGNGGLLQFGLVCAKHHIMSALNADAGQFVAGTGGRARYHGKAFRPVISSLLFGDGHGVMTTLVHSFWLP
ncbi:MULTISPECIES: hypothetical protein [Actibacterium]|uniref:Uncharacterized protein n=1 Tax=Actibacterium naphthalenivorans TaxID=1614693 RepID=A0A840C9U6_9RHOB|nr:MULTISPECIES: hypothetical protein [Actibacterium]MBB4022761.1 hypothetical protein [Actibacterium naphthalenivorans]